MNSRLIKSLAVSAVLILPLAAKDAVVQSKWAAAPVQVDGQIADWTPGEMVADRALGAKYAVRNDGAYLYFMLSLDDPRYFSTIDQSGITLWINAERKDKKVHGLHFYKKTVTADQLIAQLEAQGQPLTEERKTTLKSQPQYQLFTCDVVNKKGEAVPHPNLAGAGTFRTAQVQKSRIYEFVVPFVLLDDPSGKLKVDPDKPFTCGLEWGGMTEEMRKVRAAQLGDRTVRAREERPTENLTDANVARTSTSTYGDRGIQSELAGMRGGPKVYAFWFDLQVARNK